MHKLRKLQFWARFLFYLLIIAILIMPNVDLKPIGGFFSLLLICYAFNLLLPHVFFSATKKARSITASHSDLLKWQIINARTPLIIVIVFAASSKLESILNATANNYIAFAGIVLFGFVLGYSFALIALRLLKQFTTRQTEPLSSDMTAIENEINGIMHKNGERNNIFLSRLDLEKFKYYNLWGNSKGIVYTAALENILSKDELHAVFLYAVSRTFLGHFNRVKLIARVILAIFMSVTISCLLLYLLTSFLSTFFWLRFPSMLDFFVLSTFGLTLLILAWFSRLRVYKADKYAITIGTKPKFLFSALEKLERFNDTYPIFTNRFMRIVSSIFNPHPYAYQRKQRLLIQSALEQ